jgi:hypothetical protein
MADVNDIVCLGFGSWSSVNSLPTLGFGSAGIVVPMAGPFAVVAAEVYGGGAREAEVRQPGKRTGAVRLPGPVEAEVEPE